MDLSIIGTIVFFVVVSLLSLLSIFAFNKLTGDKREYDERQVFIRMKTFKAGYAIIGILEMFIAVVQFFRHELPFPPFVIQMTILYIVAISVRSYLLWNNALWSLSVNRIKDTFIDAVFPVVLIILIVLYPKNTDTSLRTVAILLAVLIMIEVIERIIYIYRENREVEADEES